MPLSSFTLTPQVEALGIKTACLVISGINNVSDHPGFHTYQQALFAHLATIYTQTGLRTDPVLAGYQKLRSDIGRSSRKYPISCAKLLKLFLERQTIPSINLAVDIYNCISLETRLSLGAHDLAYLQGDIQLCLTENQETYIPLGKNQPEQVPVGEYCYTDQAGIICRLEYRQADRTKVTLKTESCCYIIQGHAAISRLDLLNAVDRLVELTRRYCGGQDTLIQCSS